MKTKKNFLKRLNTGVILFDGGIGTEVYNRGVFINKCFEELNLTNPTLIQQIHEDYKKAGVDVIETNTYGANFYKLTNHQLVNDLYKINFEGARIAKEVAGDNIYVAGSMGPLGVRIEPLGAIEFETAVEKFAEQAKALFDGGVDLFILETFVYPNELKAAVEAVKRICNLPIISQMTIDDDGFSLTGAKPITMIKELESLGSDVIGINCTVGPQVMLEWLEEVRNLTNVPISIMPNAGKPKSIDGRNIYLTSPEYLGEYAKHFVQAGANIIGGCCGTNHEHIKRMRNMLDAIKPELKRSKILIAPVKEIENITIIPKNKKSRLSRRMSDGHFVKFVELLAPRGVSATKEIEKAKEMFQYGIDVINIPDGPRASARMSAMSLAIQIQREVGIETVLHFVCRDRNVIGMQSDLMGAYALGLKNILSITGDPPKLGNYPDATAVFDVDAIGLTNIINRLNHGMDIAGNPIGEPTGFFIGVGANPGAVDLENEINRLKWKIDAGAEYFVTQPIFDIKVFENFINRTHNLNVPVVAGLWPLTSLRNAEFMNNEVPGVDVPESILKKMAKYVDSKEDSLKVGIEIAKETLEMMLPLIQGVQISAPFGRTQSVIDVFEDFNFEK
jgi:methionine synthase I (cobalamin-dependent)/5,10-methylenetetrahydrofolate reductase